VTAAWATTLNDSSVFMEVGGWWCMSFDMPGCVTGTSCGVFRGCMVFNFSVGTDMVEIAGVERGPTLLLELLVLFVSPLLFT